MATTPALNEHVPVRPTWICLACAAQWPCTVARNELAEEYRAYPSVLTLYLAAQMHDALEDHIADGATVPGDLYGRFLAWARQPPNPSH